MVHTALKVEIVSLRCHRMFYNSSFNNYYSETPQIDSAVHLFLMGKIS